MPAAPFGSENATSATGRWMAAISAACSVGEVAGERVAGLRRVDRELRRRSAVRGRVLPRDQRAVQHAVLRAGLDLAQPLALVGGEGGDVDQADDVVGLAAALVITAPPYEWPTASDRAGRLARTREAM